jgi:hypothetical protein
LDEIFEELVFDKVGIGTFVCFLNQVQDLVPHAHFVKLGFAVFCLFDVQPDRIGNVRKNIIVVEHLKFGNECEHLFVGFIGIRLWGQRQWGLSEQRVFSQEDWGEGWGLTLFANSAEYLF